MSETPYQQLSKERQQQRRRDIIIQRQQQQQQQHQNRHSRRRYYNHRTLIPRNNNNNNTSNVNYQEPLLSVDTSTNNNNNNNNYGSIFDSNQQYHFSRSYKDESPRGHFELIDNNNNNLNDRDALYQPPPSQEQQSSNNIYNQQQEEEQQSSFLIDESLLLQQYNQYPAHSIVEPIHQNHQQRIHNVNPAIDIAWDLCSHGLCCCQCVRTQEIGFIEQCGEFQTIVTPGLHCFWNWPINTIAGRLSLKVQQIDIKCESVTYDHVFCYISLSILYHVNVMNSYEAYYRLINPTIIIETIVLDIIRNTIPKMVIDNIFIDQTVIANTVYTKLHNIMFEYGYNIKSVLITNININNNIIRNSINEIMIQKSFKEAATHQAEANKIIVIKQAESDTERKYLLGIGVAKSRTAIIHSLQQCTNLFQDVDVRLLKPPSNDDIIHLLLVTQYMDIITSINNSSKKQQESNNNDNNNDQEQQQQQHLYLHHQQIIS